MIKFSASLMKFCWELWTLAIFGHFLLYCALPSLASSVGIKQC